MYIYNPHYCCMQKVFKICFNHTINSTEIGSPIKIKLQWYAWYLLLCLFISWLGQHLSGQHSSWSFLFGPVKHRWYCILLKCFIDWSPFIIVLLEMLRANNCRAGDLKYKENVQFTLCLTFTLLICSGYHYNVASLDQIRYRKSLMRTEANDLRLY